MRLTRMLYLVLVLVLCSAVPGMAATIRGKVVPAVPETLVCLESSKDGREMARAWASKNGSFTLKGIKPGTYEFDVIADGYVEYKAPVAITVKDSSGHVLKLTRGAVLKGKISPVVPDERIELISEKDRVYPDLDTDTGAYTTEVGVPSGTYQMRVTAKGYAPIEREIKLTAPNTTVLDLKLEKTGSISGKISPTPLKGGVLAKSGSKPVESAEIQPDGSYRIENLPAGTYDLVIMAKGYERVVGFGPVPGPDTLTDQERKDIEAVFARSDKAWKDKDVDTVVALMPPVEGASKEDLKKSFGQLFSMLVSYSATRHFDFVVGQTGKSAVAVERVRRTMVAKKGEKTMTQDQLIHAHVTLEFKSGAWQVTNSTASDPGDYTKGFKDEDDLPRNVFSDISYGRVIAAPMEGEPGYNKEPFRPMPWKYSGDSRIVSIEVESGAESKGHDFTLTPIAKP